MNTTPKFKVKDKIIVIDNTYTKDIGIHDLKGEITKVLNKNTGISYNIVCGDDHICCISENFLVKEGN